MRFYPGLMLLAICSIVSISYADTSISTASPQDLHYYGDARVLNLVSGQTAIQKVLLIKSINPQASMITETVCIKENEGAPKVYSTYIRVSGTGASLSDSLDVSQPSQIMGTGSLFGQSWNWTFLKFSIKHISGVKIEDVNFVAKDQLIARKQVFLADGMPVQLWDAELSLIVRDAYQKHFAEMGCKQQQH